MKAAPQAAAARACLSFCCIGAASQHPGPWLQSQRTVHNSTASVSFDHTMANTHLSLSLQMQFRNEIFNEIPRHTACHISVHRHLTHVRLKDESHQFWIRRRLWVKREDNLTVSVPEIHRNILLVNIPQASTE